MDEWYMLKHGRGGITNHIKVEIGDDGHIHFCGEDACTEQIYLYPEQVEKLLKIITQRKKSIAKLKAKMKNKHAIYGTIIGVGKGGLK